MIDTGAAWSILRPEIAGLLNFPIDQKDDIILDTRFGRLKGTLQKIGMKLPAECGESLDMEATFWISDEWPGPNVIGWNGLLNHLRFGIDPYLYQFHFGYPNETSV